MKLNKIIAGVLCAFALCSALVMTASDAAVPDIKDLLKGALKQAGNTTNSSTDENPTSDATQTGLSGLKGLVEGLISKSNLTEADLVGEYAYSDPAVAFRSTDLLKKAGGAAAAGVLVDKIRPYYEKAGFANMTATFNADNTFSFKLKRITLSGTYALQEGSETGDFLFTFKIGGKLPLGSFPAHVEKVGSKLTVTFDASKLIALVSAVAQATGQSSLKTMSQLLSSYDGLACGFELKPL